MSSPRVIIQILISGTRILGKAFLEAGRQAAKNARAPAVGAAGADVGGVGHASSGSVTDQLTRQHRMTLDEAHLILNVKRGEELQRVVEHYEHLFKANSPPAPPATPTPAPRGRAAPQQNYSHYLQSKVVRARERIEAEIEMAKEAEAREAGQKVAEIQAKEAEASKAGESGKDASQSTNSTHTPPPPPGSGSP